MSYNKKGVSLVTVLIIVVVLSVLTGTITVATGNIIENTYKEEFNKEYNFVKASVNDYIMRNSGTIDFTEITIDLSTLNTDYITQFDEELIVDNKIDAYIIDLDKIGVYNATYGKKMNSEEDDVYVVTKEKQNVYYLKGFESDDKVYYKEINNDIK